MIRIYIFQLASTYTVSVVIDLVWLYTVIGKAVIVR